MKRQQGFTLIEIVIAMIVLAILSGPIISMMKSAQRAQELMYQNNVLKDNQTIVRALREYAAQENNGFLPAAYTGGNYENAPIDITNATLTEYMARGNITTDRYNSDGSTVENVKYIQFINPQPTYEMPIVGSSSETVTLGYDRAVIIQTQCAIDLACNDGTPATSVNYTMGGWEATGTDLMPVEISTLDIQQGLWRDTWYRLNEVRNKIRNSFNAQVTSTSAGDDTNWFFTPDLASSPDLSGSDPATNQGCRNGWYALNSVDVNVLAFYGLGPASLYGQTSWGGRIEYCADYDPNNDGVDALPHIAALRLNRAVTTGGAPSATVSQNLILVI